MTRMQTQEVRRSPFWKVTDDATSECASLLFPKAIHMNRSSSIASRIGKSAWLVLGATAFSSVFSIAIAAEPPTHIRGTIVSASATTLTVKTSQGSVSLAMDAATRVSGIVPSSAAQIKEGSFVGIASVPGAGASSALEVVVFPDAMKGSGLGDYPWDLSSEASGGAKTSAMTNGTVKSSASAGSSSSTSAMTNGTVKKASSAQGLVLTVDYGKGEKTIQVGAGVPVVTIVPADGSKLLPGAHVFVATKADAPTSAAFVAVGIDGTVPPM
jgi:hypothetical protein